MCADAPAISNMRRSQSWSAGCDRPRDHFFRVYENPALARLTSEKFAGQPLSVLGHSVAQDVVGAPLSAIFSIDFRMPAGTDALRHNPGSLFASRIS